MFAEVKIGRLRTFRERKIHVITIVKVCSVGVHCTVFANFVLSFSVDTIQRGPDTGACKTLDISAPQQEPGANVVRDGVRIRCQK